MAFHNPTPARFPRRTRVSTAHARTPFEARPAQAIASPLDGPQSPRPHRRRNMRPSVRTPTTTSPRERSSASGPALTLRRTFQRRGLAVLLRADWGEDAAPDPTRRSTDRLRVVLAAQGRCAIPGRRDGRRDVEAGPSLVGGARTARRAAALPEGRDCRNRPSSFETLCAACLALAQSQQDDVLACGWFRAAAVAWEQATARDPDETLATMSFRGWRSP
jgi:hypothetical protein